MWLMQRNLSFQVGLQWILSVVHLPLSQGVLLYLLWQLACDINIPSQKLAWMTVVVNAIIPTDPTIACMCDPSYFKSITFSTIKVPCPYKLVLSFQIFIFWSMSSIPWSWPLNSYKVIIFVLLSWSGYVILWNILTIMVM
jgi:hypothetical protein